MKNPRVKKSIRTLAERQNAIRRRQPTAAEITELNQLFEEINKAQEKEGRRQSEHPRKKSARPPEAQT